VLDSLCEIHTFASKISPDESNIEEEHKLYLLPLFGTSLLNIYLFILESKGLVIFYFNFSEFQQLGNKYAK